MSMEDSKQLVTRYIEDVWNQGDLEALETLTTEAFVYHLGGQPPRDRAAMRQFLEAVRIAFPDWRVEVQAIVAEERTVVARWAGQVTHQGPFHGIPPTGKQISVCGINLYEIKDGRIAREWEQMDSLGMLGQLGALARP
jgi:steroid delta-isomerase-like uncharacterized protein